MSRRALYKFRTLSETGYGTGFKPRGKNEEGPTKNEELARRL
jgi:hypothetical protein